MIRSVDPIVWVDDFYTGLEGRGTPFTWAGSCRFRAGTTILRSDMWPRSESFLVEGMCLASACPAGSGLS